MGRHRSRDRRGRKSGKKRRHRSSSSSSEERDKRKRQNERIKQLERELEEVRSLSRSQSCHDQPVRPHQTNIRPNDELLIPVFDPANDEVTVEQWVTTVDNIANQFGWDGCAILRLIVSRMRGHAKEWYELRPQGAASWTDTKAALIENFNKPLPFAKLFHTAANYEAIPGQELGDYCFKKLNALRKLKINIPEEYMIDVVIHGIKNDAIARTVRAAGQTSTSVLRASMSV